MLRAEFEAGGWRVQTWEKPRAPGLASRDSLLVDLQPARLRVAVIDGVTPTVQTPSWAGVDGAIWAAATVRAALIAHATLGDAAAVANDALRMIGPVPSSRDRPQASFAAADVTDGGVTLLRAGDCEAWIEIDGGWQRMFPREIDTADERERMKRWTREHPDRPYLEYDRARPERDDIWTTSAVGRLPEVQLQGTSAASGLGLVLATDGARLSEEALRDLPRWLEAIDVHQRNTPVSQWETGSDDLALIHVKRRP